jgi:hypothetical protein
MPVLFAEHGADLEPGHIYVAPPDHHVLLEGSGRIRLDHGSKVTTPDRLLIHCLHQPRLRSAGAWWASC